MKKAININDLNTGLEKMHFIFYFFKLHPAAEISILLTNS